MSEEITPQQANSSSAAADEFIPKPLILCPISAHKILVWSGVDMPARGLQWTEKSPDPVLISTGEPASGAEERISPADFKIRTLSPDPAHAEIEITVHCFVREGLWVESEVCEVKNIRTGYVIYSTQEDAVRQAIIEHHKKKRQLGDNET